MLSFLDKYSLIKGKTAFGVELIYTSKNAFSLIALELIGNKDGLKVGRKFVNVSIEKLAEENKKKIPIYISIGGKGIIHKKVKYNDRVKDKDFIHLILPNASINDFYLQKTILSNNECWISIVRKDVLDILLEQLSDLNLFGIEIYLGPFVLTNIFPLLNQAEVLTASHELIIEDNEVLHMDSLGSVSGGKEYDIDGEKINSHEIIAFGAVLSHFASLANVIPITCETVVLNKENYLHKNKFVTLGIGFLLFFFAIAIGNLIMMSIVSTTNNELQYQIMSKKEAVNELKHLREEIKTKEQFVANSGVAQASKISFYADQIALSIPEKIQLNQLFINPLEKRIDKAEDIHFLYNTIILTGTVSKGIVLNNFIKKIKKYDWIQDVNIISFVQDNVNVVGDFEIEIHIK